MDTYQFVRPTQSLATMIAQHEHFNGRLIRLFGAIEKNTHVLIFPRVVRFKKSWWKSGKTVLEMIDLVSWSEDSSKHSSLVIWDAATQQGMPYIEGGHIDYTLNSKVSLKQINEFVHSFVSALENKEVNESTVDKVKLMYRLMKERQETINEFERTFAENFKKEES